MVVWVFGYGSLIWRPGFNFDEACFATLHGWTRSFKQGSPDHRGTTSKPGRVLTISREPSLSCVGRAFRVSPAEWPEVYHYLEERESGGYQAVQLEIQLERTSVVAWTWVASPSNENFIRNETFEKTVNTILDARGMSGSNIDYVLNLDEALSESGIQDEEVNRYARAVRSRLSESSSD